MLDDNPMPGHTAAPVDLTPGDGQCAQNGHNVTPYRLAYCLMIIGWSVHELARRSGEHRTTIRRWIDGTAKIDPAIAARIEILAACHRANPIPRKRPLPDFLASSSTS